MVASGRPAVLARLQALFADLAGVEAHTLEPTANLLEWGLDSLILTQASQALQRQFGVRVPMRALLEDLQRWTRWLIICCRRCRARRIHRILRWTV